MSLGAMGAFISLDIFFFFIFHEFALIPTFLLIGIWGSQNRQFASFQVTIYLMAGSLILLAGLIALIMALPTPDRTFDIVALQSYLGRHPNAISDQAQDTIFPIILVGFGILVGLFPFHSWAPPGYASAPPAAAMLHAGILKKFALYGLIRIGIPLLHDGFEDWRDIILTLLAGNFLYAGIITIAQKELPTMIGFSSIMHMGYLFLGIACWNIIGISGAVLLMVAHGLSAALLFGLSGEITHRAGENRFTELGGLAQRAPTLAVLFSFASMASMGMPGLANFAGEVMVFFASARFFLLFTAFAVYGTVITAIFQLRAIKTIFYGPMPSQYEPRPAAVLANTRETVPASPGMTDTASLSEYLPYVLLILARSPSASCPSFSSTSSNRAFPCFLSFRSCTSPTAMISASYHIAYFSPVILLTVWAMGLLLAEAFLPLTPRQTAWIALVGLLLTGLLTFAFDAGPWIFWNALCKWDGAAKFFNLLFIATAMLVIWMGRRSPGTGLPRRR